MALGPHETSALALHAPVARRLRLAACKNRYAILTGFAAYLWVVAPHGVGFGVDWWYFVRGAESLTGSGGAGLHVYASMPYLQFGPLALAAAVPARLLGPAHGWLIVSAICMGLGVVTIRMLERAAEAMGQRPEVAATASLLGGLLFLKVWSLPAIGAGHPDDVLALTGVATAAYMVARQRWVPASLAIGLAAAAKPWAILALPLAAACSGARFRGVALACVTALVPWIPFLLADPGTLHVAQFHLPVHPDSGLRFLGVRPGSYPGWTREAQFGAASLLGTWAIARHRWTLVPLIAFSVRLILDPATMSYYTAGLLLGVLLWDVTTARRLPGVRTMVTWLALTYLTEDLALITGGRLSAPVLGRLVVLMVALVAILTSFQGRSASPTAPPRPTVSPGALGEMSPVDSG